MSNIVVSNAQTLAQALSIQGDPQELVATLKATAFKGQVSDAQMAALLVVANQYGLNPWTKEIYAFPDRNNGIVPVVGVDGWSRIINSNPQFDGMDFAQDDESCTCIIYRKDRSHPIKVTEWLSECKRSGQGPWQSHPKRMLRHKAMIQCARLAFGYTGIYDQDEAERINEVPAPTTPAPEAPQHLLDQAEEAANAGTEAYKVYWQSTATPDERKLLAKHHAAYKKIAESVDRERTVTDVQAKEVTDADDNSGTENA
ncbi:phage recombination protein Bet [Comamonas sp. JNW]|uniref:phage recombination protein Bet n=1 Tax=Comamonas sp. B21-038 TaxID=2918299 RepID=UPI000DE691D9|nr:phage recombination protein Bet [Comamonas sp. JNW]